MYPSQNIFGCSDQGVGGWGMWHMGEKRNAYTVLVGKPKEKRQFARPSCTWQYNIKICHEYILWEGVDWIQLAQDTEKWSGLMIMVIKLSVQYNASEIFDYFGNYKIFFS